MASINQLEKLHKNVFNELKPEEKLEFYKKLSKQKYDNYLFIAEDGRITLNVEKHNSIDNMQVFLNANKDVNTEVANASLSVIGDFEALKEKYFEEFKVAYSFYGTIAYKNLILIRSFINFLDSFLGVYEKEPSEALYNVLQETAKGTIVAYNKAKKEIDSYITNLSELDSDNDLTEDIKKVEDIFEERYSKYDVLIDTIFQLEKP